MSLLLLNYFTSGTQQESLVANEMETHKVAVASPLSLFCLGHSSSSLSKAVQQVERFNFIKVNHCACPILVSLNSNKLAVTIY